MLTPLPFLRACPTRACAKVGTAAAQRNVHLVLGALNGNLADAITTRPRAGPAGQPLTASASSPPRFGLGVVPVVLDRWGESLAVLDCAAPLPGGTWAAAAAKHTEQHGSSHWKV